MNARCEGCATDDATVKTDERNEPISCVFFVVAQPR